jgi:heterodisulfide reductase subunit A
MEMSQPSTDNGRQRKWGPRRRGAQRGELPRTGVYVCHCGINIAGTVDVAEVANFATGLPGVTVAREYSFTCSEPGQQMIANDIKNLGLERVVVAACSPRMHEPTFRRVMESAGLNPFYLQMTNIREQDSWVTEDRAAATYKAKQLVEAAVRRVVLQDALYARTERVEPATLVIGGGIAGIQAALDIADAGYKVYLVEREPTIGGRMAQLNKTFPTLDCST